MPCCASARPSTCTAHATGAADATASVRSVTTQMLFPPLDCDAADAPTPKEPIESAVTSRNSRRDKFGFFMSEFLAPISRAHSSRENDLRESSQNIFSAQEREVRLCRLA